MILTHSNNVAFDTEPLAFVVFDSDLANRKRGDISGKTSLRGITCHDSFLLPCLHPMLTMSCFLMSGSDSPLSRDRSFVRSLGKMFFVRRLSLENQTLLCSCRC